MISYRVCRQVALAKNMVDQQNNFSKPSRPRQLTKLTIVLVVEISFICIGLVWWALKLSGQVENKFDQTARESGWFYEVGISAIDGGGFDEVVEKSRLAITIADTPAEQYQGLSQEKEEDWIDRGLLFTYNPARSVTFTMRKMTFALDFIWIGEGKIVRIDTGIEPNISDDGPFLDSPGEIDAVLEVSTGVAVRWGFEVGDEVEW